MTTPPLPPYAMNKPHQYYLVKGFGGQAAWMLKKRFRTKKHRGECAGAFGSVKAGPFGRTNK